MVRTEELKLPANASPQAFLAVLKSKNWKQHKKGFDIVQDPTPPGGAAPPPREVPHTVDINWKGDIARFIKWSKNQPGQDPKIRVKLETLAAVIDRFDTIVGWEIERE